MEEKNIEASEDYQNEIEAITYSLKYRFFENALLLCQDLFSKVQNPEVLQLYVQAYLDSGSPIQASLLCSQYYRLLYNNFELQLLQSKANFECGKYEEAEKALKYILSEYDSKLVPLPIYSGALYLNGMIKLRLHQQFPAQHNFFSAIQHQPYFLNAYSYLSNPPKSPDSPIEPPSCSFYNHRSELVMDTLKNKKINFPTLRVIKSKNPIKTVSKLPRPLQTSIYSLRSIALQHFYRSNYIHASLAFEELYKMYPFLIESRDIYSTTLYQLKQAGKLICLAKRTIEIAPQRAEAWIVQGNLFSLQVNRYEAIKMFKRASQLDGNSSYALALIGQEFLLDDSLSDSQKYFREAIARNPGEWSAWYGLGSVFFHRNNFPAAEYYLKKAIEFNPENSVLHFILAIVMQKTEKYQEAEELLNRAIQLDEKNIVAVYQKSLLLNEMGRKEEALDCIKTVEDFVQHEPCVAYERGCIERDMGNYEEAINWFTKALAYDFHDTAEISKIIRDLMQYILEKIPQ